MPSNPFEYVAFAAVNPAASVQSMFDGNSGVDTLASGAGSTSISNGPALSVRPHESSPLYVIVIFPPHDVYCFTTTASIDPEISQSPVNPFV